MDTNDGGPAFPVLTDRSGGKEFYLGTPGMSLRDWFAGQALGSVPLRTWDDIPTDSAKIKAWAKCADAMLAASATRPEAPDAQ